MVCIVHDIEDIVKFKKNAVLSIKRAERTREKTDNNIKTDGKKMLLWIFWFYQMGYIVVVGWCCKKFVLLVPLASCLPGRVMVD